MIGIHLFLDRRPLVSHIAVSNLMKGNKMNRYWSAAARHIAPYTPGEQPRDRKYIKLNTNECPYPPSPKVLEAMRQAADGTLRLYPDPECLELRQVIAEACRVKTSQVFSGNGSDEILAFAFMAFFDRGEPILFPDITYSFYEVYADLFRLDPCLVPLREDFSIEPGDYNRQNGGIVLANPNAPTGRGMPLADVRRILDLQPERVVLIDEAYIDFGGESVIPLIGEYPNLLVVQTLSKSRALAGLRLGFAVGDEGLMEGLNRIKNAINSYTVDRIAMAGGIAAMRDEAYFRQTTSRIMATRERTAAGLKALGFAVVPSQANFLFIAHPGCPGEVLFKRLRERGILVRYFKRPRIDNYLRVTVGTDEDMEGLLQALRDMPDIGADGA